MATAKDGDRDIILPVAPEVAQTVTSFALDIGTSLAKVVYRSKKDYKDGKPTFKQENTKVGRLRLGLLQRLEPEALIQFVRDNVDRPDVGDSPTYVPATGYGSSIYRRQLEQSLNIKIRQMPEWDGFAAGLLFLQENVSLEPLCLDTDAAGEADGMKKIKATMKLIEKMRNFTDAVGATTTTIPTQSSPAGAGSQTPEDYASPSLLAVVGSAAVWYRVGSPGAITILENTTTAGCSFVALGQLLTRSKKTFNELIQLAKKGDRRNVDLLTNYLMPDVDQDDVYSAIADDRPLASFGKVLTNTDAKFKDEDLMASLIDSICMELVRTTRLIAQVNGLSKVYMAGNFVNNDHVRRIMTRENVFAKVLSLEQGAADIKFLRQSGYMGAIGAMMAERKKTAANP